MYEFQALGTRWWIEPLGSVSISIKLRSAINDYVKEFEDKFSRFSEDSLISELNRKGRIYNPPPEMIEMFEFAGRLNKLSSGVFNPLVGARLGALGYGYLLELDEKVADFSDNLDCDKNSVRLSKGQSVDLGGLGKGWVIDKLADILRGHGISQFIINGGGDLYVQADQPIDFALENPHDDTAKIGSVNIQKGALAASSVLKRAWQREDQRYHHIIDPTTAMPSVGEAEATFVIASSALVADCLATILIIRPEIESELGRHFDFEAKIIYRK